MRLLVGNITTKLVQGGKDNLLTVSPEKSIKKYLSYKVDGYQFSQAYKDRRWDGTKSLLKYGKFPTGMLPFVVKHLKEIGAEIILEDHREDHPVFNSKLITEFDGRELMQHQKDVGECFKKEVLGIPFYRGITDFATNAGKTYVIAAVHENLGRPWTILVVDSITTYRKTIKEFSEWFDAGRIDSDNYDLKPFTVAMAKTLSNRIKKSVNVLQDMKKFKVYMVDEAHTAGNVTNTHVASNLTEAAVRLYFSGTPLDGKNKEKKLKLIGNSGPIIKSITNREMMDQGISLELNVNILLNAGNEYYQDYNVAVDEKVIYSRNRLNSIIQLLKNEQKDKSVLITFRYHTHGQFLLQMLERALPELSIGMVHGETDERDEIIEDFAGGKIKVLIASTILKQAVNIPIIQCIINGIGGKDTVTIKQFYGRSIRLDGKAESVDYYDWFDDGDYVDKHSRYRIKLYKKEEFKINFHYKHNSQYSPIN